MRRRLVILCTLAVVGLGAVPAYALATDNPAPKPGTIKPNMYTDSGEMQDRDRPSASPTP